MQIGKFRAAFMARFIAGGLSPREEIFAICNAYRKSRSLTSAAIYSETEPRFRHTLDAEHQKPTGHFHGAFRKIKAMETHTDQNFGDKRREFIYNLLLYADHFKI